MLANDRIPKRPTVHTEEKFDILLNLYKVKPMRFSNVFKTFSDSLLLPNKGERNVLTFNSNEHAPTEKSEDNSELKNLEDQIHVSRKPFRTQKQEMIKAPNYGTQEKFEKVFVNGLYMDSTSSTEVESIEDPQNKENKIDDNSHRKNFKGATHFDPDTTYNSNNNNEFSEGQWEANLENEKHKHYYSNRKRGNMKEKQNKFNITIMIPVNTTVQRYKGFARRKAVPTEKQVLHFYDIPFNTIEEISKDDDSSVLVIR